MTRGRRYLLHFLQRLGLVTAGALALVVAGCQASTPSAAPAAPSAPVPAFPPHPLDPLSESEIASAVEILRAARPLSPTTYFPLLETYEPSKSELAALPAGGKAPRRAFVVLVDRPANQTVEALVDLSARQVTSWREVPGVQPGVLIDEFDSAAEIVNADAGFRAALARRGIHDPEAVQVDIWAPGHLAPKGSEGKRLLRGLAFYRGSALSPYGRPIEGLVAVVDVNAGKVIEVVDTGVVPVPGEGADFFDPRVVGPLRKAPAPLIASQPEGPGFELRGSEVRWQKWRFRYAVHPREGLVLHDVGYADDDQRVRSILHRASLSEMVVPYGDPDLTWAWRSAFDEGEYGLGRLANTLVAGRDVPQNAVLASAPFADDRGAPYVQKDVVGIYERDGGLLWTHTDFDAQRTESRRARELVVTTVVTVGNYDYVFNWIFGQDGALELQVELTGIPLAKGTAAAGCAACRQLAGDTPEKAADEARPDRYGTYVAPNVVLPIHQHIFNVRLDFDLEGVGNAVLEQNVHVLPTPPEHPYKNAFGVERTRFKREREAVRDTSPRESRAWEVFAPSRTNELGHFSGYMLVPGQNGSAYAVPGTPWLERAPFAQHNFFVTRYRESERYAAGFYPNQSHGGDGLARWSADDESIDDQDVVVWYTFVVTHVPRAEDWPVMSTTRAGFRLMPSGFFSKNPALDVPAGSP